MDPYFFSLSISKLSSSTLPLKLKLCQLQLLLIWHQVLGHSSPY